MNKIIYLFDIYVLTVAVLVGCSAVKSTGADLGIPSSNVSAKNQFVSGFIDMLFEMYFEDLRHTSGGIEITNFHLTWLVARSDVGKWEVVTYRMPGSIPAIDKS